MRDVTRIPKELRLHSLLILQKCYQKGRILDAINPWGFGNRMRDYLLEGRRRIKFDYLDQKRAVAL